MKKQFSVFSMLMVLALSVALSSCGSKRDEALVTEFNAKKAEANKVMTDDDASAKQMMTDHAAWSAKLDEAAKAPKADTAKIAGFRAQMKQMDDAAPMMNALHDSLKVYANAPSETNDQMKAAIAGMDAQLSACNTASSKAMQDHKKLGDDITAFLGGSSTAVVTTTTTTTGKTAPATKKTTVEPKHEVVTKTTGGAPVKKSGGMMKK